MHSLAAATSSEGLTARTSLSRISCHSSIVKVQRPGHDGPRRRALMMRLCGRGVKPDDPSRTGHDPGVPTSEEAARGRILGGPERGVKRLRIGASGQPPELRSGCSPRGG
jgi:hypothetical protein